MATCLTYSPEASPNHGNYWRPTILLGVTNSQTCVLLGERVRALRDAGYRVALISSPGERFASITASGDVEPCPITMDRGIAFWSDIRALFSILATIRRIRPDITEFSTPKAGLLGSLAAILCGIGVRIYVVRGLRLETKTGLKRLILTMTERLASACSHRVICNSQSLRDRVLAMKLTSAEKLCLLGAGSSNGVNVGRFHPREQGGNSGMRPAKSEPVIGFVGRLTRDKGIPQLIVAFDKLLEAIPAARLLLVGWFDDSEDALSCDLCAYIDSHPRITRTGRVPDTAPFYHLMDVMVLPTFREGFPNVVLEAAASGIPVITTTATGARDSIVPEITGVLVPVDDPTAIYKACLSLLRDPQRRMTMGNAARAWVVEHFVSDRVLGLTLALYEGLLRQAAPRQSVLAAKAVALPGQ